MPHLYVRGGAKRLLTSMGLTKSGNQTVPQSTNTVLTPMIVDSDYPLTVMNGTSGVKANVAGEWQITAQCTWTTSNNNRTFRLLKNGTSVTSTDSGSSNVTIQGVSVSRLAVVEGDVLTLDVNNTTLTSTARVVAGGTGTFLRAKAIPEEAPKDVGMLRPASPTQSFSYNVRSVVTGWAADGSRAGSSVSNNGLVMVGTGSVTATVSVGHNNNSSATTVRVLRNGSVVGEFTTSGTFHTTTGGTTIPFTVSNGDVLTVDFLSASVSGDSVAACSLFTTVSI